MYGLKPVHFTLGQVIKQVLRQDDKINKRGTVGGIETPGSQMRNSTGSFPAKCFLVYSFSPVRKNNLVREKCADFEGRRVIRR